MKEFLSRAGRGFIERNVDTDLDAYDELLGRGWRTVPVMFVGGAAVPGFDEAALRSAIGDDAQRTA